VFLLRVVVFAPRKHRAWAFVSEPKMLRIPFAHLITDAMYEDVSATAARFTAVGVVTPHPASVESVLA
jgi:hypothetical protein